jgi:hypothetical protein
VAGELLLMGVVEVEVRRTRVGEAHRTMEEAALQTKVVVEGEDLRMPEEAVEEQKEPPTGEVGEVVQMEDRTNLRWKDTPLVSVEGEIQKAVVVR